MTFPTTLRTQHRLCNDIAKYYLTLWALCLREHRPAAGDLLDEEALLEWLLDNKDKGPVSIIEEVDGAMLPSMVENFEYLVVYFCKQCKHGLFLTAQVSYFKPFMWHY